MWKNFSTRKQIRSRRSDSRVQKQLYLWNGIGYPHQILNKHGKRVDNVESGEISADLYSFFHSVDGHKCLYPAWILEFNYVAFSQSKHYARILLPAVAMQSKPRSKPPFVQCVPKVKIIEC